MRNLLNKPIGGQESSPKPSALSNLTGFVNGKNGSASLMTGNGTERPESSVKRVLADQNQSYVSGKRQRSASEHLSSLTEPVNGKNEDSERSPETPQSGQNLRKTQNMWGRNDHNDDYVI